MDQTGSITAGTVERLVRWAKDERFRGSIDVRGDHAATLAFSAGFIAHIDTGEGEPPGARTETKEQVQARLAERLGRLVAFREGTYVIRRTEQLPPEARWLFGPIGLLDAATPPRAPALPTRVVDDVVALDASGVAAPVVLSTDAVRVVAAMCRPARSSDLRERTGWDDDRLRRVLDELRGSGLLPATEAAPTRPSSPGPAAPVPPRDRGAAWVDLRGPVPVEADRSDPSTSTAPTPAGPSGVTSLWDRPSGSGPGSGADPAPESIGRRAGTDEQDDQDAPASRTRASALRRLIQNLR
jgi:hypothetical protein